VSEAAEKLKAALLELPEIERLELANFIYESLPSPPGILHEDDPDLDQVLEQRIRDLETGKDAGVPAELVFEKLRQKFGK
jgi:putative addiction module component (TIGR02574 family)